MKKGAGEKEWGAGDRELVGGRLEEEREGCEGGGGVWEGGKRNGEGGGGRG